MTKRFLIFMMPLCIMLFGCEYNKYGEFLFEFNDNKDGLIFLGCEDEERDRIFYVPETMYGQPVVEINDIKSGDVYAEKIIIPESVVKINMRKNCYPNLKEIIIKGKIESLKLDISNVRVLLLNTTDVPEYWFYYRYDSPLFVPDDSLLLYRNCLLKSQAYGLHIYPLSEYPGELSQFDIEKKDLKYKGSTDTFSWYYYDIPYRSYSSSFSKEHYIVLNQENIWSESYMYATASDSGGRSYYFYLKYDTTSSICKLKTNKEFETPTVSVPINSKYVRIFVYSNIPLYILEYCIYDGNVEKTVSYPGYEMTKIN